MARTQGSHAELTRPRVRAAAERLFAQHGYAAVSMRKIASEVGLQAGALYNYTADKQALLFDLMESHLQALLAEWSALPPPNGPMRALETFARFHLRFHFDKPDAVFIAYMELRNLSPEYFAKIEKLRGQYENELVAILEKGTERGVFMSRDAKVTARAIIAMLTGVTTWYRDSGALSRDDVEELYWDMVRRAVTT